MLNNIVSFCLFKKIPIGILTDSCTLYKKECIGGFVDFFFLSLFWACVNILFFVTKEINVLYINFSKIVEEIDNIDIGL